MIRWVAYRTAAGVDVIQACDYAGPLIAALRREGCIGVVVAHTVEGASKKLAAALLARRCRGCAGGTGPHCPACQASTLGPELAASVAHVLARKVA